MGLFGLDYSNHDFSEQKSFGKNIFTNAFPVSIGQYMHIKRGIGPVQISAVVDTQGNISTSQSECSWANVLNTDPAQAHFEFECVYAGYAQYTHGSPNKSDVVVMTRSGEHRRPLEIKLVVVPTSQTAGKPRAEQSCELVVRPPSVEQLAFSIAHSYGPERRIEMQEIIVKALGKPMGYQWRDEKAMLVRLPQVVEAARSITQSGIELQTPLVLMAMWRTQGQRPLLDDRAFDLFVWTDLAFLQLFIDAAANQVKKGNQTISRPARALVWLVYSLWEYSTQRSLRFEGAHSTITYGAQTDKAGSFANTAIHKFVRGEEFTDPRVTDQELYGILDAKSLSILAPERRLDAALAIQHFLNVKNDSE